MARRRGRGGGANRARPAPRRAVSESTTDSDTDPAVPVLARRASESDDDDSSSSEDGILPPLVPRETGRRGHELNIHANANNNHNNSGDSDSDSLGAPPLVARSNNNLDTSGEDDDDSDSSDNSSDDDDSDSLPPPLLEAQISDDSDDDDTDDEPPRNRRQANPNNINNNINNRNNPNNLNNNRNHSNPNNSWPAAGPAARPAPPTLNPAKYNLWDRVLYLNKNANGEFIGDCWCLGEIVKVRTGSNKKKKKKHTYFVSDLGGQILEFPDDDSKGILCPMPALALAKGVQCPRFSVGDNVLVLPIPNSVRWDHGVVVKVWPVLSTNAVSNSSVPVPIYLVDCRGTHIPVGEDTDKHVRATYFAPQLQLDSTVEFCHEQNGKKAWRKGVITDLTVNPAAFDDTRERLDNVTNFALFAVREAGECSVDLPITFILDGDFTHIRQLQADRIKEGPRELLLLGLSQNWSIDGFRELSAESSFNVPSLVKDYCPDFWIAKAIDSGCYGALEWMERDLGLLLDRYQEVDDFGMGRDLLHCLASRDSVGRTEPFSLRFFEEWSRRARQRLPVLRCLQPPRKSADDHEHSYVWPTLTATNILGQTFLHLLAQRNRLHTLDLLLSPHHIDSKSTRVWAMVEALEWNEATDNSNDTKGKKNKRTKARSNCEYLPEPLVCWKDNSGQTPGALARLHGFDGAAKLLDDFAAFCFVYALSETLRSPQATLAVVEYCQTQFNECLNRSGRGASDDTVGKLSILREMNEIHNLYEGDDHFISIDKAMAVAAQAGNLEMLRWLHSKYPKTNAGVIPWGVKVFDHAVLEVTTTIDDNEFSVHRKPVRKRDKPELKQTLDIVALAAHGRDAERPLLNSEDADSEDAAMKLEYWDFILRKSDDGGSGAGTASEDSPTSDKGLAKLSTQPHSEFVEFLKSESASSSYLVKMLKRFKRRVVEDDEDLKKRSEVLRWLVVEKRLSRPNVVNVIRWRQCGVLKWMVEEERVNLDLDRRAETCTDLEVYFSRPKEHTWLGNSKNLRSALKSLSIGEMLCFVAVECDDLQSLGYLIENRKIPHGITFMGWNLLHVSASCSRREIAAWLIKKTKMPPGEKRADSIFANDGNYASHIAMNAGDVLLAEYLTESGCPDSDSQGRSLLWYAENSAYRDDESVSLWRHIRERAEKLRANLDCLVTMTFGRTVEPASLTMIKTHITTTSCLSEEEWLNAGYNDPGAPVTNGKSFWEIIERLADVADGDFLLWLHERLVPEGYYDPCNHDAKYQKMRDFWKRQEFGGNDIDVLWTKGRDDFKDSLSRLKHDVDSRAFTCLEAIFSTFSSVRAHGNRHHLLCELAVPIDPAFCRIFMRAQMRRDTKVMEHILKLKSDLLYMQFVTDLLLASVARVSVCIAEGLPSKVLDEAIFGMMSSSNLLKNIHPSFPISSVVGNSCPFLPDGSINHSYVPRLDACLRQFYDRHGICCTASALAASVGRNELMEWLIDRFADSWNEENILQVVRVAAFYDARNALDKLAAKDSGNDERIRRRLLRSALLGAAEAGHLANVKEYYSKASTISLAKDATLDNLSPLEAAVFGLFHHVKHQALSKPDDYGIEHFEVIKWLGAQPECNRFDAVVIAKQCTKSGFGLDYFLNVLGTLASTDELWKHRNAILFMFQDLLLEISKPSRYRNLPVVGSWDPLVVGATTMCRDADLLEAGLEKLAEDHFIDIQVFLGTATLDVRPDLLEMVEKLQRNQIARLKEFTVLFVESRSNAFSRIRGPNAQGLPLAHCAAVCNRVDILMSLEKVNKLVLGDKDKLGRTIVDVAKLCHATASLKWIRERGAGSKISTFVSSCYRRKLAQEETQRTRRRLQRIQGLWRGRAVRQIYRARIETRIDQRKRYTRLYGRLVAEIHPEVVDQPPNSWETLKRLRFDMARNLGDFEGDDNTGDQLDAAYAAAGDDNLAEDTKEEDDDDDDDDEGCGVVTASESTKSISNETGPFCAFDNIKITKDVLKWLRTADAKFAGLFFKRIRQLAAGDRSRILEKGLTGCRTTIFETYLEMKAAHRIIWTPCKDQGQTGILVWYVARHKLVSHYIRMIDDAEKRSSRTFVSAGSIFGDTTVDSANDILELSPNAILLDPLGDTPLKLHQIKIYEMKKLRESCKAWDESHKTWTPPLRLTQNERNCVDKEGTVVLLGRSGTGKTICICNRIDKDRRDFDEYPLFRQLFVARSNRICKLVQELVDDENVGDKCTYWTFKNLLTECEKFIGASGTTRSKMALKNRVDFPRFKHEFYCEKDEPLDPLIVWTQIRTFIKGSIESVVKGRALERDEYMNLGQKQSRLTEQQRSCAYAAYQAYCKQMESKGLWDDCDLVARILRDLQSLDPNAKQEMQYDRVYVDEVQDYTQAEVSLFYMLCSQGSLFFAGDTAQSVVEGVDFRFQDLRTVAYTLYQGHGNYIPEKPLTVNVNFRSHSGVLNLAANVLERLFSVFPGSAKELPPDEGIYRGPRPGIFKDLDMNGLRELLKRNPKLFVLTHDEHVDRLQDVLGTDNVVIGIRDAKGLEFKDIVIVNFFLHLEDLYQKPWRQMLVGKDQTLNFQASYPQMEGQLKLVYTAITRCSKRLFFAETEKSVAGQAFWKWLTVTHKMAEFQDASKMEQAMTPDEWRSTGVDFAIYAEINEESPRKALGWLNRAMRNFERVEDEWLLKKARAHKASLELRIRLLEGDMEGSSEMNDAEELEIANAAYGCAKGALLPELFNLIESVLPKLSEFTQELLQKDVMKKIERVAG